MYLRIGRKILNTNNMVDANVYEAGDHRAEHGGDQVEVRTVVISTTAIETGEDGTLTARKIWLEGDDAYLFLESLPVYAPVLERET